MTLSAYLSLLQGAAVTVVLSLLGILVGVPLGLGLALVRWARIPVLNQAIAAYVSVLRATPLVTLVLLMAAGHLEETCRSLIQLGRSPSEPAAIVMWATTEDQRQVVGTLETLPALALASSIGPPATLIVGQVAAFAETLDNARSLSGCVGQVNDDAPRRARR